MNNNIKTNNSKFENIFRFNNISSILILNSNFQNNTAFSEIILFSLYGISKF
jgi:hypothetical protein